MKRSVLAFAGLLALILGGCSSGLDTEDTGQRGPAPFSPDPTSHIAQPTPDPLGAPRY